MAEKLSKSRSSSQIKKLEKKIMASQKFKEDAVKCIKDLKTAARSYKDKAYGLSVELEYQKEVSIASKRNGLTDQSTPVKQSQNETHEMCSPRRPISQGKENKNDCEEVKKNVIYTVDKGQKRNLELVNASTSCQVKKGKVNNIDNESTECPSFL